MNILCSAELVQYLLLDKFCIHPPTANETNSILTTMTLGVISRSNEVNYLQKFQTKKESENKTEILSVQKIYGKVKH